MTTLESTSVASAPEHLFAYGSLVDPRRLDDVLGHPHPGERVAARLSGYQRVAAGAYPYPFIVASAADSVDGILVMDLSPCDIQALDRYEEIQTGVYARRLVEVEAWGCGPRALRLQAYAYVAGPVLIASTGS
jgi:gamma-glutamylcyclotransferase (GGCT)/AIG2-like uncharacterized protein YtfP